MKAGTRSSLQYHERKRETLYVLEGRARIELETEPRGWSILELRAGQGVTIAPGRKHRTEALTDYRVLETSTPEMDDVIRLQDDAGRTTVRPQGAPAPAGPAESDPAGRVLLYLRETQEIARNFPVRDAARAFDLLWKADEHRKAVFVFGNGGNAGIVANFVNDLSLHPFVSEDKRAPLNARRFRVHDLTACAARLTGTANDLGFENVFAQQMLTLGIGSGDVAVGLSASGNSANVLKAFELARRKKARVICFTGRGGGAARGMADVALVIPGTSRFPGQTGKNDNNFHIEDFHLAASHILTGLFCAKILEARRAGVYARGI
jgi:D-sedoheptulose 7-phosphate isomerase